MKRYTQEEGEGRRAVNTAKHHTKVYQAVTIRVATQKNVPWILGQECLLFFEKYNFNKFTLVLMRNEVCTAKDHMYQIS